MFGRESINRYDGGDGYDLRINDLHEELRRLGKWRANAPLRLQSNSSGFVLSLEGSGKARYYFQNNSSSVCPVGGIVKITSVLSNTARLVTFNGQQPDTTWSRYYAVSLDEVQAGKTGPCSFYSGEPEMVKYQSGGGTTVGPRPNQWEAAASYPGLLFCGALPISGQCQAVQQPIETLVGYTTTSIGAAGGNVAIAIPIVGGWQQTTMEVACSNWLLNSPELIAAGRKVFVQWVYDRYVITQAECG